MLKKRADPPASSSYLLGNDPLKLLHRDPLNPHISGQPPANAQLAPSLTSELSPGAQHGDLGGQAPNTQLAQLSQQSNADRMRGLHANRPLPQPSIAPRPAGGAPPQPGQPAPGGGGVPPIHAEGGITIPPDVNHGQGATMALDTFAPATPGQPPPGQPPPGQPPPGQPSSSTADAGVRIPPEASASLGQPPPQFGGAPTALPPAQFAGEPPSSGMGGGSGAGPGMQQSPVASPKPPAGLKAYTQQASMRLAKMPPEGVQEVMQGASHTIADTIAQRGPAAQQQLQQIMRGGQVPIEMQREGVNRLTTQGFGLQEAWQTFQGMDGPSQFLLVAGLGLGAIGLISALSGQGGVGSFLMTALGLGAAGGAAAHGGLFGQGAQQTMQGMLGTQQPTPPAAGGAPNSAAASAAGAPAAGAPAAGAPAAGGATPTAQGRIRLIDQAAISQPGTLPALFKDFAGELPPAERQRLDQAADLHSRIRAGGMLGRIAQAAYTANDVNGELTRLGISPRAIPAILSAWAQWSPANPPRPQQPVRPAA